MNGCIPIIDSITPGYAWLREPRSGIKHAQMISYPQVPPLCLQRRTELLGPLGAVSEVWYSNTVWYHDYAENETSLSRDWICVK